MREFRLFGKQIKVARAATPTVTAFFIGVLLQTIFNAGTVVTILCWVPFAICIYLGFFYYKIYPVKFDELLDWQQKWQYLNKPESIGLKDETFPTGTYYDSQLRQYKNKHLNYFNSDNVDVVKGLAPTIITIIGAILFVLLY